DFHSEIIDTDFGYFKAKIIFQDNSKLFLFELVEILNEKRQIEKYRYHYQGANEKMIFRWDNAPHFQKIKSFPHHIHIGNKVKESVHPSWDEIFLQVINHIEKEK
ncbi:MAG: DUF6516 family protein, partial [Bacteroidota bacterium]